MWKLKVKADKKRLLDAETDQPGQLPIDHLTRQPDQSGPFVRLRKVLERYKQLLLRYLERIDSRLSNQQRKWLFYLGLLFWSGFLFYLLGMAIRTPPASFIWPIATDSSQTSIKK